MTLKDRITVKRAVTESDRNKALIVLQATYREEKAWVTDETKVFQVDDLTRSSVSWFVAYLDDNPVGVLRVLYDPPLELYKEYGFKQIGEGIDVAAFIDKYRAAEIGRFAVLPEYRRNPIVVVMLMAAASMESIQRGCTHYITDVFEGEKHSPYDFHTRVMGFKAVATHDVGELLCANRRITMVLDMREGYRRLRTRQNWIYRLLTEQWPSEVHRLFETPESGAPQKMVERAIVA
jgi:ribosomal protein S18 acetylase RimI-like enzyme